MTVYPNPYNAYPPWKHEKEHIKGGSDELKGITSDQLDENTIYFEVDIPIIDSNVSGLAADSTGVKWTSGQAVTCSTVGQLKGINMIASATLSATDAVVAIEALDPLGNVIGSLTLTGATDVGGSTALSLASFQQYKQLTVRANVTTASATAGATFDIKYITIKLSYGFA